MSKSDWDQFDNEVRDHSAVNRQGPKCKTCTLLNTLPVEKAAQLARALASPREEITSASIRKALLSRIDQRQLPSSYSIARHRRGECRGGIHE